MIWVDPYFPLNKLTNQKMTFIGFSAPLNYRLNSCCGVAQLLPVWIIRYGKRSFFFLFFFFNESCSEYSDFDIIILTLINAVV